MYQGPRTFNPPLKLGKPLERWRGVDLAQALGSNASPYKEERKFELMTEDTPYCLMVILTHPVNCH